MPAEKRRHHGWAEVGVLGYLFCWCSRWTGFLCCQGLRLLRRAAGHRAGRASRKDDFLLCGLFCLLLYKSPRVAVVDINDVAAGWQVVDGYRCLCFV